jgi:predicted nucleic acid-binding protein
VILMDTGPIVALLDPRDAEHERCKAVLKSLGEPLITTTPVLTEAFHLLPAGSWSGANLRAFLRGGGAEVWFMDGPLLERCFELMEQYADHPMELADASLVVAAERLRTRRIFTLDRDDFSTYRLRRGRTPQPFEILPGPH